MALALCVAMTTADWFQPKGGVMLSVVFHNCEPERSGLVISVGGKPATPEQLDKLTLVLNGHGVWLHKDMGVVLQLGHEGTGCEIPSEQPAAA